MLEVFTLLAIFPSPPEGHSTMFRRSADPPTTNGPNGGVNNPNALNDPNRTTTGQGGVVQGFVFTKWLRLHLVDLITMAIMGAVGLGVYYARKLTLPC